MTDRLKPTRPTRAMPSSNTARRRLNQNTENERKKDAEASHTPRLESYVKLPGQSPSIHQDGRNRVRRTDDHSLVRPWTRRPHAPERADHDGADRMRRSWNVLESRSDVRQRRSTGGGSLRRRRQPHGRGAKNESTITTRRNRGENIDATPTLIFAICSTARTSTPCMSPRPIIGT